MTLTEFLLARIAEDEAGQQAGIGERYGADTLWHEQDCELLTYDVGPCDCGVPYRVLADCEAKRRIIEEHSPVDELPDAWCERCIDRDRWPCPTMSALALPYADHTDYRDEWRP